MGFTSGIARCMLYRYVQLSEQQHCTHRCWPQLGTSSDPTCAQLSVLKYRGVQEHAVDKDPPPTKQRIGRPTVYPRGPGD